MKCLLTLFFGSVALVCAEPVLDARKFLTRQSFWINQDIDWFENNIPIFDCPDPEINTTYYYRWELVSRHLVYGNPNSGYAFTEFSNRPFWSGAYGTISCPAGHQISEVRWLNDPRYVRDFVRFWMRHPGAQPRNYSFWAADATWSAHLVHPNNAFVTDLLPDLVRNYEEWERRCWVPEKNLFWQLGHDDGMEFDINSRQTNDILRGGQSLRPSFNTYMWADARAISNIAKLKENHAIRDRFTEQANRIKEAVESQLWDPDRQFFFPMSQQEHSKDGHVVRKHTLTYQSGQFAGSPHGRELHGYVPWAFNLPGPGFENAWQFLMDDQFFKAEFGPTTVERNDPLFMLSKGCCWWSGQSWPFATTQTLKAMANLLHFYQQDHVDRNDYTELLRTYSLTHRKDGKPYIAEAVHPFTGSWEGHDMPNRSEHYFHSGFTDLIITGLIGLQPSSGDELTIHPLAPDSWDHFAMDRLPYRGHTISVIWDRSGTRYGTTKGFHVFVNGKVAASTDAPGKVTIKLPPARIIPVDENPPMNFAVNNDGDFYPRLTATHVDPKSSLSRINDGQYRYDIFPTNRWTSEGSLNDADSVEVDFGTKRGINTVKLYVIDDGKNSQVRAPEKITLEHWDGRNWKPVPGTSHSSPRPVARRPHIIRFPLLQTSRLRAVMIHSGQTRSGLTEIETWGPGVKPYSPARPPAGNLAFNPGDQPFPKITASFSDQFGGLPPRAVDGKIIFEATPMNRWTSYGSKNPTDWIELEFAKPTEVNRLVLHLYDDRGGVQPPKDYAIQGWTGQEWTNLANPSRVPETPTGGMANIVTFDRAKVSRLRVLFTHQGNARSGLTEWEVWND